MMLRRAILFCTMLTSLAAMPAQATTGGSQDTAKTPSTTLAPPVQTGVTPSGGVHESADVTSRDALARMHHSIPGLFFSKAHERSNPVVIQKEIDPGLRACLRDPGQVCFPSLMTMRNARTVSANDFMAEAKSDQVLTIWTDGRNNSEIQDGPFYYMTQDGEIKRVPVYVYNPFDHDTYLSVLLHKHAIPVRVGPTWDSIKSNLPGELAATLYFLMTGAMVYVFWVQIRAMRTPKNAFKPVSKSKMKTFDDVAGNAYLVQELKEIADVALKGHRHENFDLIPRGVLMSGPPGTGKTLLASAFASAINAPFYSVTGSDFVETYVGTGSRRMRTLLKRAGRHPISVVLIDEVDIIAAGRGSMAGDVSREYAQTLTTLLTGMDGFDHKTTRRFTRLSLRRRPGVIIFIGATNRYDILDPAVLRPGRFDRHVVVGLPDLQARTEIARINLRGVEFTEEVSPGVIGQMTNTLSGADITLLVKQARLMAMRKGRRALTFADLDESLDLIQMGTPNLSKTLNLDERRITAYHEAGHALVALMTEGALQVRKITTVPRGSALGMVSLSAPEDSFLSTRKRLMASIVVALAGRAAEELILQDGDGEITSGAEQDIAQATRIARLMVGRFGMCDDLGLIDISSPGPENAISEATRARIDQEVRATLKNAHHLASWTIKNNRGALEGIVAALTEKTTITGEEAMTIIQQSAADGTPPRKTDPTKMPPQDF